VEAARLYIELLKKCVSNSIYDDDLDLHGAIKAVDPATGKLRATEGVPVHPDRKYLGVIWPSRAHTMIGIPRLDNLQWCVESVIADGVPGDLIETGVWRGGATIFMRGILKAYGITDRKVWVADSFAGLPEAKLDVYPQESTVPFHQHGDLDVSLEKVKQNFASYGLLDGQVAFLRGWFCDTLPTAPIERLAVMRLDGDLYESTMDGLVNLYSRLSIGGFVIIDDFNSVEACNRAVADFRRQELITEPITQIQGAGAYWRKTS
jgi:hypothetical protein